MSADWIAALKPGDLVIVVPGGFIRREEVGRVGCRARIAPCAPGDEERITGLRETESLAAKLGAMSWRDWEALPLPTLRAVRDLLAAAKGEKS